MNRAAASVAILSLLCACVHAYPLPETVADPAVREIRGVQPFRISGGNSGQRRSALTTWDIQYDYSAVENRAGCRLEKPHVTLGIRQQLPAAMGADPAVDVAVLNSVDILLKHEEGHLRIDQAGAHHLADALRAVQPQRDCRALAKVVHDAAMKAIDECRAANEAYDAATRHGTN